MICKSAEYRNGYIFTSTSTDKDFQEIIKNHSPVHCIICNENTVKNFKQPFWSNPCITINKKLSDGVFFINGIY